MKTSHYKTPRTLAECEFPVGYASINENDYRMKQGLFMLYLFAACFILGLAIGYGLYASSI